MGLNRNLGQLTEALTESSGNVLLNPNNVVGGTNVYIGQTMASNDTWRIYGNTIATDRGEMVFELGDNAESSSGGGQRFRFYYNPIGGGGTAKSPFILDYNDATFNTNGTFSGNVGIGTTSLNARLTVSRDAGVANITGISELILDGNSSNGPVFLNAYSTGNTIICNGGGNVGIGTMSPISIPSGQSLTIGNASTQNQPYLMFARNSTGGFWGGIRWYNGTTLQSSIQEDSNANLLISTSNTERMRITSSGNVLIGTQTDSGHKLNVAGAVNSRNFGNKLLVLQPTPQSLGLPINANYYGGAYLLLISTQFDAGNGTAASLWMIRCGYDGNNFEAVQISVALSASGISFSQVNGILHIAGNANWSAAIQVISNKLLF
jgi:hypothetical protein